MGKQRVAVADEHIESAMLRNVTAGEFKHCCNFECCRGLPFGAGSKMLLQGLQQQTERLFTVCVANGQEVAGELRVKIFQVAVVSKYPGLPPKFAGERVAVLKFDLSDSGLAYVGNDVAGADWILTDEFSNPGI